MPICNHCLKRYPANVTTCPRCGRDLTRKRWIGDIPPAPPVTASQDWTPSEIRQKMLASKKNYGASFSFLRLVAGLIELCGFLIVVLSFMTAFILHAFIQTDYPKYSDFAIPITFGVWLAMFLVGISVAASGQIYLLFLQMHDDLNVVSNVVYDLSVYVTRNE